MSNKTIVSGVLMDEKTTISFVEVCQQAHISEDVLLEFLAHGLGDHTTMPTTEVFFDHSLLHRVQSASRLQHDLGINTPGVVLVLELLDELEQLRRELSILQHHVR